MGVFCEGLPVGWLLGSPVGNVGIDDGWPVGAVGSELGCPVGSVGCELGCADGSPEGWLLGSPVGDVGIDDGWPVGAVGCSVGSELGCTYVVVHVAAWMIPEDTLVQSPSVHVEPALYCGVYAAPAHV
jgi:hypothetical protein